MYVMSVLLLMKVMRLTLPSLTIDSNVRNVCNEGNVSNSNVSNAVILMYVMSILNWKVYDIVNEGK